MPTLLLPGTLIDRVHDVVFEASVAVENGSQARYARDVLGRAWVSKGGSDVGWNDLFAEGAAWALGQRLGVRSPTAAFYGSEQASTYWLSARVATYVHWHHAKASRVNNLDELGRMLALDAIVGEGDRHARNILLQPDPDENHLTAWAVDSANALIGQPSDFLAMGLEPPDPWNHARGLPIALLNDSAMMAAQCASSMTFSDVAAVIAEVAWLAPPQAVSGIIKALAARCHAAPEIVPRYLQALSSLK